MNPDAFIKSLYENYDKIFARHIDSLNLKTDEDFGYLKYFLKPVQNIIYQAFDVQFAILVGKIFYKIFYNYFKCLKI